MGTNLEQNKWPGAGGYLVSKLRSMEETIEQSEEYLCIKSRL